MAGAQAARARRFAVSVAALAGFAALAIAALGERVPRFDREVFRALYSGESLLPGGEQPNSSGLLDALLPFIYRAADNRLIVAACLVGGLMLLVTGGRRRAALYVLAVAVPVLATLGFERLFERAGPYPADGMQSFPSGHAMITMAVAAATVWLAPAGPLRWFSVAAGGVFVVACGIAVIADGGHWPSDVLAGWLIVLAWVSALAVTAPVTPTATRGRSS